MSWSISLELKMDRGRRCVAGRPSLAFGLSMVCDCELCVVCSFRSTNRAAGVGGKVQYFIGGHTPHHL